MPEPELRILRTDRRTLALEVRRDGSVVVRAPRWISQTEIDRFVQSHADWLARHYNAVQQRLAAHPEPTPEQASAFRARAKAELPALVELFGTQMGLRPAAVKITSARTRFGSCNAGGTVCFSWRLMAYPQAAIEYVVVHELAHLRHMNHGPAFWALVAQILPDWRVRRALLRV